ncbi:hypothetical protein E2C01_008433 [Portunus trituberculatus]|uniref:Uncharacterized protein n=1 Tax=Portunus trituberculatus TaxID=210409 RepID=A0A5B7D2U8_PORTR|nr:hypothetical protein [Portunus trituberculatus]
MMDEFELKDATEMRHKSVSNRDLGDGSQKTSSAPYSSMALHFTFGVSRGTTTLHGSPAHSVPKHHFSRSGFGLTALQAPLALKEPVFCKFSALKKSCLPASWSRQREVRTGVRWSQRPALL